MTTMMLKLWEKETKKKKPGIDESGRISKEG
jgi:hypothetical protein